MELSPLDLLDAARRWAGEADSVRSTAGMTTAGSASAFSPGVRESAVACSAAWGDAADRIAGHIERCAEGLRHTAELTLSVDADAARSFERPTGGGAG